MMQEPPDGCAVRRRPRIRPVRLLLGILVIWFVGKVAGCCLMATGPWGPEVRGDLPDGGYVCFQSRPVGRETDKRLVWVAPGGAAREFMVDRTHAGFGRVVLKLRNDGKGVWVEADGKVGASLDLETGEFRPEYASQFDWAAYGAGRIIGAGRTSSILWLLGPW